MTTEIVITGVGCPIPSATDAGPGVLIKYRGEDGNEAHFQFDAGRATVMRLMGAGSAPGRLDALFLTHHHSDHCTGLQDIVLTRWVMDRDDAVGPLTVVAPEGPAATFAENAVNLWADDLDVRREHTGRSSIPEPTVQPFPVPQSVTEVWRSGEVTVLAGQVRHQPVYPAVGYRIETPDGIIAISGDTLVCDEVGELAEGADVLVYEAMRFSVIDQLPPERRFIRDYHADTLAIGKQAAELGVQVLVLTHLIPPPQNTDDREAFLGDIRQGGFTGEVIVAQDLDSVSLG